MMAPQAQQLSLDEMAAQMADNMLSPSGQLTKGGAAGNMPQGRGGASGAEGGFTPQAGGQVIDAKAAKGMAEDADPMDKAGAYTGSKVTNEPGRQGGPQHTGAGITSEPKGETGPGGAGEPANVSQAADDDPQHRQRKAGKVGGMGDGGVDAGKNLSEDEDDAMRKRKSGKVGISKAEGYEEDEEDEEKSCKKSEQFDADDLIKSLETLEAVAQGSSVPAPADRRAELAEKLAEGTLNKAEMTELSDLMKAGEAHAEEPLVKADEPEVEPEVDLEPNPDLAKSHQEQFADDAELSEGYEVSPFLERHSQMTAAALDQVQNTLSKSLEDHRDRATAFNSQLAKSLMGMAQLAKRQDEMIKSLTGRLGHIENQPLPRRGVTSHAQVLNKSMGESEAGGGSSQLNKSQVADTLEQMAMQGILNTESGYRVDMAMAMLEQGGQIAKSLYNDVVAFRNGNGRR
jgi:hypothetical protein